MGVSDAKPLANYLKSIGTYIVTVSIGTVFSTLSELGTPDGRFEFDIIDPTDVDTGMQLASNIRQLLGEPRLNTPKRPRYRDSVLPFPREKN